MKNTLAIIYDFDGTLAPGNMTDYSYFHRIKVDEADFWKLTEEHTKKHNMDPILSYLHLVLAEAKKRNVSMTKEDLINDGVGITFFDGVLTWFDRINNYGKSKGVNIDHYVISSGIKEMIDGCAIRKYFKEVYACSYVYDDDGVAIWPAVSINYTNKTQFLFRIRKKVFDLTDSQSINKRTSKAKTLPFSNMIYIGDGFTDIPCMKLIKGEGGSAIGIFQSEDRREITDALIKDKRINFSVKADYSEDSEIEKIVKLLIDKMHIQSTILNYQLKE